MILSKNEELDTSFMNFLNNKGISISKSMIIGVSVFCIISVLLTLI